MRLSLIFLALLLAAPATAQEPEWRTAPEEDVLLRPWQIEPHTIRLEAGEPVKLRFVNQGQVTFSVSARDFFGAARIRAGDAEEIADGSIRLAPGERRTVALVPARGRYRLRCGSVLHRLLGMSAEIVVE